MLEQFTGSRSESFGSDPGVRSARPAAAPSDLDLARPQTAGEEELQLQLALAMSREEAEKEEERRRSDDVRLALAMAQSQEDGYSILFFIRLIVSSLCLISMPMYESSLCITELVI